MIVQGLLDFVSQWIAGLLSLIPPLPKGWNDAVAWITDGSGFLGGMLQKLGVVVPWSVLATIVAVWVGLLVFWAAMLAVRLVLFIVGR